MTLLKSFPPLALLWALNCGPVYANCNSYKIIKPPLALNAYLDLNNTVRTLGEALVWMSFTVQEAIVLIKKKLEGKMQLFKLI